MSLIRKIPGFRSGKKWKMVLASIFYIFIFLVMVGALLPTEEPTGEITTTIPITTIPKSATTSTTSVTPPTTTVQLQIYTGDTENLLPRRDEINTEYKIVETKDSDITEYATDYQSKGLKTTGFESGSYMELEIFEGTSVTIGYIAIFKFDSTDHAKSYYNNLIDFTKNEGGYKEKSSSGINAECFALEAGNYVTGYSRVVYCNKKNIFFTTEISTFRITRLSEYKEWPKTIANKI